MNDNKTTTGMEIRFNAKKIERPDKTFEEIEAEVEAFNQAQRELLAQREQEAQEIEE